jgi:hypothetical protein
VGANGKFVEEKHIFFWSGFQQVVLFYVIVKAMDLGVRSFSYVDILRDFVE